MSDIHEQIDWPRLGRYLAGECTAAEAEAVRRWIETDSARAELLASLEAVWKSGELPPADEDRAWRGMRARIAGVDLAPRSTTGPVRQPLLAPIRRSRPALLPVAAAAMLVAGAALAWQLRPHPRQSAPAESWREVATARGQRANIRLGEGTQIVLGVASKLRYREPAPGGARDVYLEGEAYFDIAHDSTRPFTVHAANALARDLGTTFTVRAYRGDAGVRVVVAHGTVSLRPASATSGAVLRDRALGVVDTSGGVRVTPDVAVDRYLAWTKGELAFNQAPLGAVLAELARWYDVDFQLADPALGGRSVTLSTRDASIEHVLDGVALLVNARYARHGRVITLSDR